VISVKICGITSLHDAQLCVAAGARALGFVFYGRSPRAVSPATAREIGAAVPKDVRKVGVFVNMKCEHVEDIADAAKLDIIQLSGDEAPGDIRWKRPRKVVKAFRARAIRELEKIPFWTGIVHAVMIDSGDPAPAPGADPGGAERRYGGTGILVDFNVAKQAKKYGKPIILAGGLDARTAVEALRVVEPSAIDVCSGVEVEPGRKDPHKVKLLFDALHRYEDELRVKGGGESARFRVRGAIAKTLEPPRAEARGGEAPSAPSDLVDELPG
jgi:phosphoribosylanthranilate isomerase